MLKINTNLSSLIIQSNLKTSTLGLNQAIERMTTGFKINGAKDNAAGYSIATNMSTKLSSYQVAEDNAAMGLDLINTASDSLSLVTSHLQRMRDLAEQASNGTYGADSLAAIQSEIDARAAEISRIAANTGYNGINLFGESGGVFIEPINQLTEEEAVAQGYTVIKTADELQAMEDNLSGKYILMNNIDLSGYDWEPIISFSGEFNGNGWTISNLTMKNKAYDWVGLFGMTRGASISNVGIVDVDLDETDDAAGLVGKVQDSTIQNCYVTGTIAGSHYIGGLVGDCNSSTIDYCYADVSVSGNCAGGLLGYADNTTINNSFVSGSVSGGSSIGGIIGIAQSNQTRMSYCYADIKVSGSNEVGGLIGRAQGAEALYSYFNYERAGTNRNAGDMGINGYGGYDLTAEELNTLITNGTLAQAAINITNNNNIAFQVGINSDPGSQIMLDTSIALPQLNIDVSNSESARNALAELDEYLKQINEKQTEYGAAYNRLESVIESININIENLASSRSTIMDADIAEESSQYIKMQILQQASATLLATANQTPAIALQLL